MTMHILGRSRRVLNVALSGSLIAAGLAAGAGLASAQTAEELTRPSSTIEAGVGITTAGSYKAGEYNGLQRKGLFVIGDIDVRGGGAYDSGNAFRFRVRGTDLGLDTRSLAAQAGIQGRFRVGIAFDEIRRNRSDSYQTPLVGAGTNVLTLPGTWLVPVVASSSTSNNATTTTSARGLVPAIGGATYLDTQTTSPTLGAFISPNASQLALMNAAAGADLPLFHGFNIETTRTRLAAALSVNAGDHVQIDASYQPEHKSGTKLMGTVSRNTGGDIATVIPDRIDTDTSQTAASLMFRGAKGFVQVGYYGSHFTNNVASMSWQNWATPGLTVNTMSSAPSNNYLQFGGSGAYNLSSTTKVVASGSYGRSTQNDLFLTDATTPVVPVPSLNGLVVSTAFNARLTSRLWKKLTLTAAYKYDNRDNRTAINIFQYADAGELPSPNSNFPAGGSNPLGAVVAQNANANRPYSRKLSQVSADLDWAFVLGQHVKVGYERQNIDRSCPGSWISCADAAVTNETILRAEWRVATGSALTARLGYENSQRRAPNYNEDAFLALVPYANVAPAGQTVSALQVMTANGLTGYGPVLGYNGGVFVNNTFFANNSALGNALYANNNRISELIGMRRYYVADRDRQKLRAAVTWQTTDAFSVQATGDYNRDTYPSSTYGLQHSRVWTAGIDGSYALTDNFSADVYYTYESLGSATAGNTYTANSNAANVNGFTALAGNACDGYTSLQQRNNSNKLDPCLNWFTDMSDRVSTVGFALRGRFGKFDAAANLLYSTANSSNNVTGGNWANNPLAVANAPAGTTAAYYIAAAPLPAVTSRVTEFRLNATYAIAKAQSIRLLYSYLRSTSADWAIDGMQIGGNSPSGVLPTNEQPVNYRVHVIGLSWVLTF